MLCWCRWQHKGKKKKQSDKEDLYALLGLGNERWTANDNQIKLGQSAAGAAVNFYPVQSAAYFEKDQRRPEDPCPECMLHMDDESTAGFRLALRCLCSFAREPYATHEVITAVAMPALPAPPASGCQKDHDSSQAYNHYLISQSNSLHSHCFNAICTHRANCLHLCGSSG